MLDALVLAGITGAIVYLVMVLVSRRSFQKQGELKRSEQRFRGLTELSADWFWETDAAHRVTWLSGGSGVATFFGQTPTYGKRFWEIPRVEVEPRALEDHLERLERKLPFFDLEISRSDERGARQIHIVSGQSRLAPDGSFLGYRGVGRDATEQRRAERALFEAKERLELAFVGGNLAEWDHDLDTDQLFVGGDHWNRLLGREPKAGLASGADLVQLIHEGDREAMLKAFKRALKGETQEFVVDYRVRGADGSGWRWLRSTGRVTQRDSAGRALRMTGVSTDISERKRAETELQETEQRYRALIELAPDGVVVSCNRVIEYANPAAARIMRVASPRRLLGLRIDQFVRPVGTARYEERIRYLETGPGVTTFEDRPIHALDGTDITFEVGSVSFLERGRLLVLTMFRDVTEQRRAREALAEREQRFRDVAEASGEYVWETDVEGRYTYLSERVEAVRGYARAEMLGRRPHDFIPLGEAQAFADWFTSHIAEGKPFRDLVYRSMTKSGGAIWLSVSGVPVRDAHGVLKGFRGTGADVTARKNAEARIEYLATRDALTGLPNRLLLTDRAGQAILAASRNRTQLALLCFDLDRFKLVNDSLGYQTGDALLRAVAERLQHLFRYDSLARLGGDEFVLLQPIRGAEDAAVLARRVLDVLARPFTIDGKQLAFGASIGISIYPNDGRDFAELLKNADAAMHHAKDSGRGSFRFFSPALHERAVARLRLENELRSALARSELVMHWQPVYRGRLNAGMVVGAEALVRWQHPERGLLLPEEFVPMAEECGLIRAVGEWTLARTLSQAGAWQRSLAGKPWFAVNVSAPELAQGDIFLERVREALAQNGVDGSRLELEVTERTLMASLAENTDTLRRIGELGVRFAIDDFGTGYSSLAYLRTLPINKLKIDRSFLRELDTHHADEAIVRAITVMAKTLGISVAAEGVETEAQLKRLIALGCDEWQGHLFSHPLDAPSFERLFLQRAASAG